MDICREKYYRAFVTIDLDAIYKNVENILKDFGPDSYIGRCASVVMGSTETTFYAITLYYGSINIKKTRHTLPSALCADFTSFILSPRFVKIFFK